jgi:hypothetical protein
MPPMPAYLWKKLVVPGVLLILLCFVLNLLIPWQGFFLNLAVTLIGILFAVLYVDYILKQHEENRWAPAKLLIEKKIFDFATITVSQFRVAFKINYEVLNREVIFGDNLSEIREEMVRLAQSILLPSVDSSMEILTKTDRETLIRQLKITWENADKLLSTYGNWIEPEKFVLIMEIQEEIWNIIYLCVTFPEIAEIHNANYVTRGIQKSLAKKIRIILEKAILLLRKLNLN